MPIIKQIEFINKKNFAKAVLNKNIEAFVVYVTFFSLKKQTMTIYPIRKTQIASLLTKKITIFNKYSDFSNVFLEKRALVLLESNKQNQHAIKLQDGK